MKYFVYIYVTCFYTIPYQFYIMDKPSDHLKNVPLIIGTLLGWLAILIQFYLHIENGAFPIPELVIRFFSYFTILTNILVALSFSILLFTPHSVWGRFFSKTQTLTAITVYITIVGIVYNTILRFTWNPQGLQRVVDELLHLVIPCYFIIYWIFFVVKSDLHWRHIFRWLTYPFVYLVFILFRGALSNYYPYPFLDVNHLSYARVGLNCGGLLIAFLAVSLLFVAISKIMRPKSSKKRLN